MKAFEQLKWIAGFAIILFFTNSTNAQLCSPNPMYTTAGVHPDTAVNLATGCVNSFYQQDFTLVVPADTVVFGIHFPINYVMIDSISGLPPGILFSCNPPTCTFPGGSSGCFQLYGYPGTSGTFNLTFYIHGEAVIFGTPMTANYTYPGYEIHIGNHPVLTTGSTSATCNFPNGSAWVSATGSSGYGYSWNTVPVSTNDSVFNVAAGIYQVTVNDLYNCATIDTVIINDLGAPQIDTILITNTLCYGSNDGSATVVASGGTLPYEYVWVTADTTATLSNVGNGTYSVSVSDLYGCQVSSVAFIGEPSALLAFTSHTDVICNGENTGTALATAIGGTGSYSYDWSSGDSTATASSLSSAIYTVTITDDNGCTATSSATVSEPSAILVNIIPVDASCFEGTDGMATASASGGMPGYTYLWSNADTTNTTSNLMAGTYDLTVTDSVGCTVLTNTNIGSPSIVTISLLGTDESIFGASDGSVDATIGGGTPGYTYLWSNTDTTQDISGLTGGMYILQVTDLNGCINSDTITIQTLPGFGIVEQHDIFEVYPNPVSGYFYLEMTGSGTVTLYDVLGNQFLSKNANPGKQLIELPILPKGIYILTVQAGEYRSAMKLMIE